MNLKTSKEKTKIVAAITSTIVDVNVKNSSIVSKGQIIVTVESMKMQSHIVASAAGLISDLKVTEGETVEDYLLTDDEIEKFAYVEDDYVEPNPGTILESDSLLFVAAGYVLDGYINIESSAIPPYVLEGYVSEDYIVQGASVGDYSAYVGVYYNDLGEST